MLYCTQLKENGKVTTIRKPKQFKPAREYQDVNWTGFAEDFSQELEELDKENIF